MYSWLVTVLLLASAANGSGGQGTCGKGEGGGCDSVHPFHPQVRKSPSQATHVHSLAYQALVMMDSAQSVEDFGRVLSRKEPVLLY